MSSANAKLLTKMPENPYQSPEIASDTPEHPPSVTVGGVPGLRGRYRIDWKVIAAIVVGTLGFVAAPLLIELLHSAIDAAN